MATITLQAEPRTVLGKKVRHLRASGLVPANIYGHRLESVAIQLPEKVVATQVSRASHSTLFELSVAGDVRTVLVKDIQRHPTTSRVLHVDFYQVARGEKVHTSVPLHFVGEAPAVRRFGGTMLHSLTELAVEALPDDLPSGIDVDVSGLETTDDAIHVRDIAVPNGVLVLTDGDEVVAKVAASAIAPEEATATPEEPTS